MRKNIIKLFVVGVALLFNINIFADDAEQWIRYSAISPDGNTIAFTYKGDIYIVEASGGEARQLTFHQAQDFMPVWSNDSKMISFASDRFGDFDIFVIDALGGNTTRLTYHSSNEYPYTFTNDDKHIIFGGQRIDAANHRQYPTGSQPEVYMVPVAGGRVSQQWTIPAEQIQISRDGKTMVYHDKKGSENEWRKHHVSAIARDIWKYDVASNQHTMITTLAGEDRNPVFADNDKSLYFLSERSGTFNVHKLNLSNPNQIEQITAFELHPVRFLSISNSGKLCYTQHGDLYTQTQGANPQKLDITIRTGSTDNNEQIVPVTGNVSEMAVSPDGKEVAYIVRGEAFASSVEGNYTKRITNTIAQERFVSYTPDGKAIIYASQRNSKWGIYQATRVNESEPFFYASTLIKEEKIIQNDNDNYLPQVSPDGKEIAFIENLRSLKIYNIETKQIREILGSDMLFYMSDGDQQFQWSPDSKWILARYSPSLGDSEIVLLDAMGSKKMENLTESGFGDYSGKWVNGGNQILWFSDRHGLRSHATSGNRQLDVYSLFLTRDGWDKFNLSKDEYDLWKEIEKVEKKKADIDKDEKNKKKAKKEEPKVDSTLVKIDWDGLRDRKKRLTIHSSNLSDAVISKDGETLYYLTRFEKGLNLWSTSLRTQETKMIIPLNANSASLEWNKDMSKLFMLSNGQISTIDLKSNSNKPISISSELTLDVSAEREQMFDHVWKRTKAMFYTSNFHGAPWDKLREEYQPKVALVGNDFELAELLSEMLGELNVSHSGARLRQTNPNGTQTASLGIFPDYTFTGDGIRIAEIIKFGPMDKSHINVGPGMIIMKIDGEQIASNVDQAKYLNRKADQFTSLKIFDPATGKTFLTTVKPISQGEENSLLYNRWTKKNEEEVERLSNGQLGYVHIPGMSDGPYRNTYDRAMGKYSNTKGLIIDTRFNGGGDLVSDLAMFLTGKEFIEYAIETRSLGHEPTARWTKPSIAMVNESNYSDGHCFACGYQDLEIGKIVGMPVPGTCSFAGWEMLQNGRIMWGAVPVSAKNMKGEWLENNQTVPDFVVKNMPGIIDNGRDEQLEVAVKELMKTL